jgi:ATP-dependent RNA helicase DeaD
MWEGSASLERGRGERGEGVKKGDEAQARGRRATGTRGGGATGTRGGGATGTRGGGATGTRGGGATGAFSGTGGSIRILGTGAERGG